MVIENQIPKTETVYELKEEYKVPSFEEFMKTYEYDANLSYDDLNSWNISETRGYGPCDTCRNCTEQWTYLYIRCPAVGCKSKDDNRSYWYHGWCGGRAMISNRAKLKCSNCSSERHMSKWNFRCSNHTGDTDESVDRKSFNKCLGMALQNEDCDQVISDLVVYITNHRDEWPR